MSPILDLLNRLFLANPTQALEIVTHMFEQHTRDVRFWRDKYERTDQDLSAALHDAEGWETFAKAFEQERDAEFLASEQLKKDYASQLDQKHMLAAQILDLQRSNDVLGKLAAERFNRITWLEKQAHLDAMRIKRLEQRIAESYQPQ